MDWVSRALDPAAGGDPTPVRRVARSGWSRRRRGRENKMRGSVVVWGRGRGSGEMGEVEVGLV